jgi:UDPglucose--hexose-1-phosphate uridylyltransferase
MELESTTERVTLIDPAGNRAEQVIEHRVDPLDGTIASLNAAFGEKARAFLGAADVKLLEEMEQSTRATCPFCAAAEKGTRFLPAVAPEGQIRIGDALAMPNLFSKCALDAVVVVDPARHVLFPSRLSPRALADAVRAAGELVRRARAQDPSIVHHIAGMNFLAPSGSSVPHAHFQVHVRGVPYSGLARSRRNAAAWADRTGRSFFEALLEHERERGERWVGSTGAVRWIAAFAPAHQKEIWGVLPGTASLADVRDEDAAAFGEGISRVVRFYEESGTHPFTLAFHSSPDPAADARSWALHVRICARPAFRPLYVNYETWFGPKFFGDDVHTEAPEAYAARLRARW